MNNCDICGGPVEESVPFRICSQCLFTQALQACETEEASRPARRLSGPDLSARPDFFEKYEILERIGVGGQGDVWKVWDLELRRSIAMKRLGERHVSSEAVVYRFLAEAQIASQLEHPGILPIFDVGLDPDGRPFYTTQLLPGTTLEDVWRMVHVGFDSEWTLNRGLELLLRVCEVMAHAHSHGVIHRDLKPSNILVGAFGDVRVIDWGSAFVLENGRTQFDESFVPLNRAVIQTDREQAMWGVVSSPLSTAASGYPVTVVYMPPEALRGDSSQFGSETDVYSMGVMLYQLLSERLPYSDPDGNLPPHSTLRTLVMETPAVPVRSMDRKISRDLAAICDKAMAREKFGRYRTMLELAQDIRARLETRPVQARHPGPILKLLRWAQRHAVHVLLGGTILLILCAAFAVVRGLKAQRDVAQQVTALRSAELAARSGQWREALWHWTEAEAAGYKDSIYLGLQRAEAWTVLSSPLRSRAELAKLFRRADLQERLGVVLLRLGEHELFDKATFERGVQHVRESLATGLTGADEKFAHGLLAESTPAALEFFRQALEADPYHHGAHRHSLGLEFTLGRHQELQTHLRIFNTLFPDDPSAGYLEAAEFAAQGKLKEAETSLARLRDASDPEVRKQMMAGFHMLAATAQDFDVDVLLGERRTDNTQELAAASLSDPSNGTTTLRTPELPCLQPYRNGWNAVNSLALPLMANPQPALEMVKSGWRHHPEALLPAFAGKLLDNRQPRAGPKSVPLLAQQAELFQMAADSPSILPGVPRYARFLAATAQCNLARTEQTNFAPARVTCLQNIRRAAASEETSAAEHRAYFELALELADYDLARELLGRWERQKPEDPRVRRSRIKVELASSALGPALNLIDKMLVESPDDGWVLEQREEAKKRLNELIDTLRLPSKNRP